MVGMAEVRAPISLYGVAVHPNCWCICLCYLHFAPENAEDGKMYLLVPSQAGCPGHSLESRKMVVCVCVCVSGKQESLANAKVNVRQHCVNEMPIMDYILEYNNFSFGTKIQKIYRAKDTKIGILDDHFLV